MILKMKIKLDIDEVQEIANWHLQEFSEGEFTDVN